MSSGASAAQKKKDVVRAVQHASREPKKSRELECTSNAIGQDSPDAAHSFLYHTGCAVLTLRHMMSERGYVREPNEGHRAYSSSNARVKERLSREQNVKSSDGSEKTERESLLSRRSSTSKTTTDKEASKFCKTGAKEVHEDHAPSEDVKTTTSPSYERLWDCKTADQFEECCRELWPVARDFAEGSEVAESVWRALDSLWVPGPRARPDHLGRLAVQWISTPQPGKQHLLEAVRRVGQLHGSGVQHLLVVARSRPSNDFSRTIAAVRRRCRWPAPAQSIADWNEDSRERLRDARLIESFTLNELLVDILDHDFASSYDVVPKCNPMHAALANFYAPTPSRLRVSAQQQKTQAVETSEPRGSEQKVIDRTRIVSSEGSAEKKMGAAEDRTSSTTREPTSRDLSFFARQMTLAPIGRYLCLRPGDLLVCYSPNCIFSIRVVVEGDPRRVTARIPAIQRPPTIVKYDS